MYVYTVVSCGLAGEIGPTIARWCGSKEYYYWDIITATVQITFESKFELSSLKFCSLMYYIDILIV